MAEQSDGDRRERSAALGLGETAPDSVRLLDLDRIVTTLLRHGAHLAYCLGSHLAPFAFVFSFLGTWREEEV